MAVTTQPFGGGFSLPSMPSPLLGVPPGLEYLSTVDQLIVKQKIEVLEILTACETRNKYNVFNSLQQLVFYSHEESDLCHRICCGPMRGFTFHIEDNYQREVISLVREFKCCAGCPWCADGCCAYPIDIFDGQGQKLGMMRMTNYCCYPHFGIFDKQDNQLYQITGGCCRLQCVCCRADIDFPVTSITDGTKVANVAKQWGGVFKEMVGDADNYSVTFPMDMHVVHKALIFASVFILDMTLYEKKDGQGSHLSQY